MSTPLEKLIVLVDSLRTQVADIQNQFDEMGRSVRVATYHNETTATDFQWLDHSRKSLSAALVAAFDVIEQVDAQIAVLMASPLFRPPAPPAPPPGGEP